MEQNGHLLVVETVHHTRPPTFFMDLPYVPLKTLHYYFLEIYFETTVLQYTSILHVYVKFSLKAL